MCISFDGSLSKTDCPGGGKENLVQDKPDDADVIDCYDKSVGGPLSRDRFPDQGARLAPGAAHHRLAAGDIEVASP
jgi:hypothetical protein